MSHYRTVSCAAIALVAASGCHSLGNLAPTPPVGTGSGKFLSPGGALNEVYGGFRSSVSDGSEMVTRPESPLQFVTGVVFLAVDAPICLVVDTVTLPITVPSQIERRNQTDDYPEDWRPEPRPAPETAEEPISPLETRPITDPL